MADKYRSELELKGDVKDVQKKLDKVNKKLKGLGDQAERTSKRSIAGFSKMGLGLTALAGTVVMGLKKSIQAFGQQELAEKKLEAALGRTSKALLDQAAALQKQTRYGDEAIIEAQAMLAAFTDDEEQIKALTRATLDLAAAKGMDLASAADLVGKSFGSTTNALTRYGIQVEGAAGSTDRLKALTENTAKLFGGQAAAQAQTMTGAIEQMKNALGDVAEDIGSVFAPAILKMAKLVTNLTTKTGEEETETRLLFATLKDVNASQEVRENAIETINARYGKYLPNLLTEKSSLEEIENAQNRVSNAMLQRIALSLKEKEIRDLLKKRLDLEEAEPALIDKNNQAYQAYMDQMAKGNPNITAYANASALANERLKANRQQQEEVRASTIALNEQVTKLAESFNNLAVGAPERPDLPVPTPEEAEILGDMVINWGELNDQISTGNANFDQFVASKMKQVELMNQEQANIERFIELYPVLAEKLGLVKQSTDETAVSWENFKRGMEEAAAASVLQASTITSTTDAMKAAGIAAKKTAATFISAEIQKAVSSWIRSMLQSSGPLAWLTAPVALAGGAAFGSLMGSAIQRIQFAEGGIVKQPVFSPLIRGGAIAGEAGPEAIIPLSGNNIISEIRDKVDRLASEPRQVINIGNAITTREFVQDHIQPISDEIIEGELA